MRLLAVVVALACVLVLCTGPASAHGNHLSADDQYSENGTVVVETVFTSIDGFVVLHANDNGEPGKPIGHAPVEYGFSTGVTVDIEEKIWRAQNGNMTVWAVLHVDDGDGKFEPGEDEQALSFGGEAQDTFVVGKRSTGPAYVVADGFGSQETTGSVTIERVALGHDGALVVRADENGEPGRVVGRTSLSAGSHGNVTVELEEGFHRTQDTRFSLWASLEERGSPVRLDGSLVASEFGIRKTDGTTASTEEPGAGGNEDANAGGTGGEGPGFGVVAVVCALVLTGVALAHRRRR
jgi:hypothetical protein